jgi:hypothetical protein
MRIKLDLEDFKFVDLWGPMNLKHRALVVHVEGRPFSVFRSITPDEMFRSSPEQMEYVDRYLVQQMEVMLAQIMREACAAIPDGTKILPKVS